MNHKFNSVNVRNKINKKQVISTLAGFILEKDMKEIYDTQYNNINFFNNKIRIYFLIKRPRLSPIINNQQKNKIL